MPKQRRSELHTQPGALARRARCERCRGRRPPRARVPASDRARAPRRRDGPAGRRGRGSSGGRRPASRRDGRSAPRALAPRAGARPAARAEHGARPRRWSSSRPPAGTCFSGRSCSACSRTGAELAAELGARAVELRARLLLLGAIPEDAPERHGRARDDRRDERRPRASSRRWMHRAPSRRRSAPAERPSGGSARRRRASRRCAGRSPSRARPTRTRSGRSQRS